MSKNYAKCYADGGEIQPISQSVAEAAERIDGAAPGEDTSASDAEMKKLKRQASNPTADKSPKQKRDSARPRTAAAEPASAPASRAATPRARPLS
jgi:hypothetical protein